MNFFLLPARKTSARLQTARGLLACNALQSSKHLHPCKLLLTIKASPECFSRLQKSASSQALACIFPGPRFPPDLLLLRPPLPRRTSARHLQRIAPPAALCLLQWPAQHQRWQCSAPSTQQFRCTVQPAVLPATLHAKHCKPHRCMSNRGPTQTRRDCLHCSVWGALRHPGRAGVAGPSLSPLSHPLPSLPPFVSSSL